jgi:CHAD domain-containing protein
MRQAIRDPAGTRASRVAHCALEARAKRLARMLARCADDPDQPENVHQLRVATRRLDAGLAVFAEYLPRERLARVHKPLRRLRRVTRDLRDLDVLAERLAQQIDAASGDDVLAVVAELRSRRGDAADRLREVQERLSRKGFTRRLKGLLKRARWRGPGVEPAFAEASAKLIRPVMDEFFAAAEEDLADVGALHQFRLRAKRLRYSLELLSGALDPRVSRELEDALRGIQERLGDINDRATAEVLLAALAEDVGDRAVREQARALLTFEHARREHGHAKFLEWWRGAPGEHVRRQLAGAVELMQSASTGCAGWGTQESGDVAGAADADDGSGLADV